MKGLLLGVLALAANAGLFLLVSLTNVSTKPRPPREAWVVREVFQPAPPPPTQAPSEDSTRREPKQPTSPPVEAAATMYLESAPESFAPRQLPAAMDLGTLGAPGGLAIPPPRDLGGLGGDLRGGASGPSPGTMAYSPGQVDRAPERSISPLPAYPQWARARRLEGIVTLHFVVDAGGAVREIAIESVDGDQRFGPVAVDAVSGWKYRPGLYQGHPVAVRVIQRLRFRLEE